MPAFLQRVRIVRIARNADHCNSQRDSVRPSVCLSITFRCCVQMNEDTNMPFFSVSGRTIHLVSGEVKFIRIFAGDHPLPPAGALNGVDSENLTSKIDHNLETVQDRR